MKVLFKGDLGKYERGEAAPSIDFANRIDDAPGVMLDYLVGEGQSASLGKKLFNGCKPKMKRKPFLPYWMTLSGILGLNSNTRYSKE